MEEIRSPAALLWPVGREQVEQNQGVTVKTHTPFFILFAFRPAGSYGTPPDGQTFAHVQAEVLKRAAGHRTGLGWSGSEVQAPLTV